MRLLRIFGTILVLLLVVMAGAYTWLTGQHVAALVDPAWQADPVDNPRAGDVTVTFHGTTTMLFDDGSSRWMVDGWFSRPTLLDALTTGIAPDKNAIRQGLAAMGVSHLDAVLPVHAHFDHAMDVPEVARQTGALVYGGESVRMIARGQGLAEDRFRLMQDKQPFNIGKFTITPIKYPHFVFNSEASRKALLENTQIPEPLTVPADIRDFRLGTPWALHIDHPAGRWVVVGSAGVGQGILQDWPADTVFLGIGGIGSQTAEYREQFWKNSVGAVKPSRLFLVHWDSLLSEAEGALKGPVMLENLFAGGGELTEAFLAAKKQTLPDMPFITLPRDKRVLLYRQP